MVWKNKYSKIKGGFIKNPPFILLYLTEQQSVTVQHITAGLLKHLQKIRNRQTRLFFTFDINNYPSVMQHDQPVAAAQGVTHIMSNHQRRQMIPVNDPFRQSQNFSSCFRIKGCRMFI